MTNEKTAEVLNDCSQMLKQILQLLAKTHTNNQTTQP